eukprot:scaffold51411_cov57-Phaeocystis_antarctica.AAC.1
MKSPGGEGGGEGGGGDSGGRGWGEGAAGGNGVEHVTLQSVSSVGQSTADDANLLPLLDV